MKRARLPLNRPFSYLSRQIPIQIASFSFSIPPFFVPKKKKKKTKKKKKNKTIRPRLGRCNFIQKFLSNIHVGNVSINHGSSIGIVETAPVPRQCVGAVEFYSLIIERRWGVFAYRIVRWFLGRRHGAVPRRADDQLHAPENKETCPKRYSGAKKERIDDKIRESREGLEVEKRRGSRGKEDGATCAKSA